MLEGTICAVDLPSKKVKEIQVVLPTPQKTKNKITTKTPRSHSSLLCSYFKGYISIAILLYF